ncbi:MAG: diacylglycerol kinase family protein [Acidimicrobiales bacterium]
MTTIVLCNPSAGRRSGTNVGLQASVALAQRSIECEVVAEPTETATRRALAKRIAGGIERVIAVGGDGLVNIAVQELCESEIPLGLISAGTGNDFAMSLGLPDDFDAAIDAALATATAVDAIRTNYGWVASVATMGFSVTTNVVANKIRWPRDGRRYVLATALALPRLRTANATIEIDGSVHELPVTILAIGNTRTFGSGTPICPDADPFDGLLDVVAIGPLSRRELVRFYRTVDDGTFLDNPLTHTFRGSQITISGGSTDIWGDGDPLGPTPVTLEAVPGVLMIAGVTKGPSQ